MKLLLGLMTMALTANAQAPPTVYEAAEMSPQNMDYDALNNMFPAHPGWYNGHQVHYYKFRMYTPGTYGPNVGPGSSSADVPLQSVYVVTTTGDLTGVVGNPIIEFHHADGLNYSDFMQIQYVTAPADYVENSYTSMADIADMETTASGIVVNMPVVPTGATLQHPHGEAETDTAPISPTPVWYNGNEVWTYVFEVTDEAAADFWSGTRENATDPAFSITVTPFATPDLVSAIPIWHVNQYTEGVEEGVNSGGPWDMGMRNLINLDRGDPGYSPLWQVFWMTELPMNYAADDVTDPAMMTPDNGFETFVAPMFVNCPDIGLITPNPPVMTPLQTVIYSAMPATLISGSPLPMQSGLDVTLSAGDAVIGTTTTNMMGAYEYELAGSDIPEGTTEITVTVGDTTRTIPVAANDYLDEAPPTVYEAEEMSPQNMDFDAEANVFAAHAGWYNDRDIHYYKFRMYTPGTYSGLIGMGSTGLDVPIQNVYIVTNDGQLTGAIGNPIIQYHHVDGLLYSDFMEINFVAAPADYVENTFQSEMDIMVSGAEVTASGIYLNFPVVPTGALLEDPHGEDETSTAPIFPTVVWYKGTEVHTYVFEVTDEAAADFFASTRTDATDPAYSITVTPFVSSAGVSAIPIWHVNQFNRGVEEGNGGGPDPAGMKNVINLDRADPGYSPLWQVYWATGLPINYEADQASNAVQMTEDNGFTFFVAPMFVNCPDIGLVGEEVNDKIAESYMTEIDFTSELDEYVIMGAYQPFAVDQPVSFQTTGDVEVGTTTTQPPMGAFSYNILDADLASAPDDASGINVVYNGEIVREIATVGDFPEGTPAAAEEEEEHEDEDDHEGHDHGDEGDEHDEHDEHDDEDDHAGHDHGEEESGASTSSATMVAIIMGWVLMRHLL